MIHPIYKYFFRVEICGALRIEEGLLSNAKIQLHSPNQEYSVDVNSQGGFCHFIAPGKYSVRVSGIPPVTPEVYNIDVTTKPQMDLFFTQFKANVEVDVICLDKCQGYKAELHNSHGLVATLPVDSKIKFTDIAPGSYYCKSLISSEAFDLLFRF